MERLTATIFALLVAFLAGFFTHLLYQRWNSATLDTPGSVTALQNTPMFDGGTTQGYRVSFVPLPSAPSTEADNVDLPVLVARDVEKIRGLTGQQARVRGRVFRVGHSAKSNTYFLNFGPSREAMSAVIFAGTVELFEKNKLAPKNFENKEVEITGQIKDHPQFGLEMILENPKQIKILD
jgi:hypothetical protein